MREVENVFMCAWGLFARVFYQSHRDNACIRFGNNGHV
jgi:hypothetical protein